MMHPHRSDDTPFTRILRWTLFAVCCLALALHRGWGVGLSAALALIATGVSQGRRPWVPVSGMVRIILEGIIFVLGLWSSFRLWGGWWGILLLVATVFSLLVSAKRMVGMSREPSPREK